MKTKRILALLLCLALCLCFAGCGEKKEDGSIKVAIVKQMDHISLDSIADSIAKELDAIAAEKGITIHYEIYSGQNDQSTLKQICDQAIADRVDAIIPIATLAAQVATISAKDTKTPVIYAAVSDPKTAELTGLDYVTGTSDALNTELIMNMMLAENPDIKKIGLLYSQNEVNSEVPIADAKAFCAAHNIEVVEATGNTNEEVISAAATLIANKVEAVFTPTDNVIMAAELAIYQSFIDAKIPHYAGAEEFVIQGAFTTCGVNYPNLGTLTADLAYQAISEGLTDMKDMYLVDGGLITVNSETAQAIGLDYTCLDQFGSVSTVTTSLTRE